jgi:fumarate reductase iron-sulfur subunit
VPLLAGKFLPSPGHGTARQFPLPRIFSQLPEKGERARVRGSFGRTCQQEEKRMGADLTQVSILARREIEARILSPVMKAMIQEMGKERALAVLRPIIQSLARESGAQMAKLLGGNTLEDFARSLSLWTREDALRIQVLEQSKNRYCFNVTRCRYAEMYKELGISEYGVLLSCGRDSAMVEGFNPRIKFTRTQTLMEGADHCDFCYEEKGP